MEDCFENIIGISKTTCECFSDEFSEEAKKSNSGLFMDQLGESPSLDAYRTNKDCGATLEEVMTSARANAIADYKRSLYQELGTRYTVRQQTYEGTIGQASLTGAFFNIPFAVAGVALEMQPTRGATVQITGIQPLFNYDGQLTVTVSKAVASGNSYNILSIERVITLNTLIANPIAQAPAEDLILDATDESGRPLTYLFTYNTEGIEPRTNTTSCGCGGKETIMHQYLRPFGIVGADASAIMLGNRTDKINGLLLTVEARCGTGGFICENYNRDEFIRESMNWAILYRSVSNSITGILNSTLINRYSMANREQMAYNKNVLEGKFRKSILWLAEHMDLRHNDCYVCTPGITGTAYDYQKDGILI